MKKVSIFQPYTYYYYYYYYNPCEFCNTSWVHLAGSISLTKKQLQYTSQEA